MSTDAIVLLKADHKQIREQFRRFTAAGENATAAKGMIVNKIIELAGGASRALFFVRLRDASGELEVSKLRVLPLRERRIYSFSWFNRSLSLSAGWIYCLFCSL